MFDGTSQRPLSYYVKKRSVRGARLWARHPAVRQRRDQRYRLNNSHLPSYTLVDMKVGHDLSSIKLKWLERPAQRK